MSVTVSDLLKLPSLRQARVIGGAGGLKKVVSSISVLESTDPGVLINEVFRHNKYPGSEMNSSSLCGQHKKPPCRRYEV